MKSLLITALLFSVSILPAMMPAAWSEFQKDIGIQAAQFRNSPEHQQYRQQKETRSYIVGDTETFWRWNLSVMPPLWIQTPATCRAVGEHSYIFVADSEWNVHMTQANVDTIMVRLEQNTPNNPNQGAIMMDVNLFGPIPDELDNDPKLIVFYSALGSFQGTSFDGYFSAYNQVTEAQAQQMNPPGHSNECEMIYMTCYPLNPVAPIRLSVLAHELQHLIHWGQDPNEESWINEGCAELAMVAYGIPDPITGFPVNPDNNLTTWNQQTADYVKVMLFFTYLYEHYDQTGLIRDLVEDPLNGMTALDNQVAIHFPTLTTGEIIRNWSIANVLDTPAPGDGLYNYSSLTLPDFSMTSINMATSQTNVPLNGYAADYLKYTLPTGVSHFQMVATNMLYITVLRFNSADVCLEVSYGGLGASFDTQISSDSTYKIVIVLTNFNPNGVSYFYAIGTVSAEDNFIPVAVPVLNCYPNPFTSSAKIKYHLRDSGNVVLNIYNIKGQLVKNLINEAKAAGQYETTWSIDSDDNSLSSGIYFIRLTSNGVTKTSRITYLKKSP